MSGRGWIGVDLDGTLAHYAGWVGPDHIGEPVPRMVARVRDWLALGIEVRIVTARAAGTDDKVPESAMRDSPDFAQHQIKLIEAWCEKHIGARLPVTAQKDYAMMELWDDRAVQVVKNTGLSVQEQLELARH